MMCVLVIELKLTMPVIFVSGSLGLDSVPDSQQSMDLDSECSEKV